MVFRTQTLVVPAGPIPNHSPQFLHGTGDYHHYLQLGEEGGVPELPPPCSASRSTEGAERWALAIAGLFSFIAGALHTCSVTSVLRR